MDIGVWIDLDPEANCVFFLWDCWLGSGMGLNKHAAVLRRHLFPLPPEELQEQKARLVNPAPLGGNLTKPSSGRGLEMLRGRPRARARACSCGSEINRRI